MSNVDINKARAVYYNFFSKFFVYSKNMEIYKELVQMIDKMIVAPLDTNTQKALENLKSKLNQDSNEQLLSEFDEVFSNPNSTIVPTTASFYNESIENGTKRLEMLQFLAQTPLRRDEKSYCENEDHIGFITTVLYELINRLNNGESVYESTIHCIFGEILNSFADDFIDNLYNHDKSDIYKDVATIMASFIAFERLYLDVAKPAKKEQVTKADSSCAMLSDEEIQRRAKNKALKKNGPKGGGCVASELDEVICDL